MPIGLADLLRIRQELGFYGAGGGRPSLGTDIGQGLTNLGQGLGAIGSGIEKGQDIYSRGLAIQKQQSELTPIAQSLITPQVQAILGQAQNAPIPLADLQSGRLDTMQRGIDTATLQALAGQAKYGNLNPTEYGKISYGGLRDIQAQEAKQKLTEAKDYIHYNPNTGEQHETPQPGDIYGKRSEANAQAGKIGVQKLKAQVSGQIPEQQIDSTVGLIKNGKIAVSQLPGFGATSLKGRVIAKLASQDPTFSFMKNESDFQAVKDYTKYINSGPYQNTIKYLESVQPNLDEVVRLSDTLDKTKYPLINLAQLRVMKETGDPNTAAFGAATIEVADQVAKILQGGGTGNATSDAKLNQAQQILSGNFAPEQFKAIASELKLLLGNRQQALENDTVKTLGIENFPGKRSTKPNTPKTEAVPQPKSNYDNFLSKYSSSKAGINALRMQYKMDQPTAEKTVKDYLSRQ